MEPAKNKKIEKSFKIINRLGLHARPASMMAQLTGKYESDIYILKEDEKINGKSIMGIITLAAGYGTTLKFVVTGPDAEDAIQAIGEIIESKFGED